MIEYTDLPAEQAEPLIFAKMQSYDEAEKTRYMQIGLLCREVESRELWRLRSKSFDKWLRACCPFSYSTARAALHDCTELADVPADDLAQIPQSNISTLKQLSTAVRRDPKVLKAAKEEKADEFVSAIRVMHPGQAIEHRKPLRFNPEESGVIVIEEALLKAAEQGARNRDEALEMVAVSFLQQCQMEEQVEAAHSEAAQ